MADVQLFIIQWREVAKLSNFEINPSRSFIRRCKKPEIVNHLQMLRVLELQPCPVLSPAISASDYILSLIHLAC